MSDIYNLYKEFEQEEIIFSYKGEITNEMLASVYELMDQKKDGEKHHGLKKKLYHVLIESLQNLFHHAETSHSKQSSMLVISKNKTDRYQIITGNMLLNDDIDLLKSKIEKINSMDAGELRKHHVEKLNSTELSEKNGAGLGLIDMARKSGNKIEYEFQKISDQFSFFILKINLQGQ